MSELRATTISDLAGTGPVAFTLQQANKGWCNASQSSGATILDSFNISSITDDATGTMGMSFTTSFTNATYNGQGTCEAAGTALRSATSAQAAGEWTGQTRTSSATELDYSWSGWLFNGDLA